MREDCTAPSWRALALAVTIGTSVLACGGGDDVTGTTVAAPPQAGPVAASGAARPAADPRDTAIAARPAAPCRSDLPIDMSRPARPKPAPAPTLAEIERWASAEIAAAASDLAAAGGGKVDLTEPAQQQP